MTTISKKHYLVLLAAFLGWMFDGFEQGLFPIAARPALQDMFTGVGLVDKFVGGWMGVITAGFLLGAALGGWVFGWLGDRLGRVRAMALSILVYSLSSGFAYFARQPEDLFVFRFFGALGMGGEWSLGVALVMEVWPDHLRPLMAGLIGAAANVGYLLVGIMAKTIAVTPDSWRWVWLVGALPALLVFFILYFVPESERWQAEVKKAPSAPLREIFGPTYLKNTLLGILFASVALIGTWGSVQWLPLWVDQLVGKDFPTAKGDVGILCALGAICGCIVGPLVGGKFGRRPAYFLLCFCSLFLCQFLFRSGLEYGGLFRLLLFGVGFSTAAFYGWFPLFLPELFPTRSRATGQGVCFNTGRVFAAVASVSSGQLVASFDGNYARAGAVVTLVYLVGMVIIWFAPETKGKPLPD
ncbi:MAG: MFS transporter [Candidatus Hydrogenedentes bacterium]|nr:MFS transporter [Candidatus Hydrogenedentota bacterium]